MIPLKTFLNRITSILKPEEIPVPVCLHEFVENGQIFLRVAPKKYQLTNRHTCKLCKENSFLAVGENNHV